MAGGKEQEEWTGDWANEKAASDWYEGLIVDPAVDRRTIVMKSGEKENTGKKNKDPKTFKENSQGKDPITFKGRKSQKRKRRKRKKKKGR